MAKKEVKKDAVKEATKAPVVKEAKAKSETQRFVSKTYKLVTVPEKMGPQVKLIIEALKSLKTATTAQITEAVKDSLETRQAPKSVVAFYVTQLKKKGIIAPVEEAA